MKNIKTESYTSFRLKWAMMNLLRMPAAFLRHPAFTFKLLIKRLAFWMTGKYIGETISAPDGTKIFNVQTLCCYWVMNIVRELDGPWVRIVRETPAPTVLDVGSNYGVFSNYIRHLNPGAQIISFDPWEEMAAYTLNNNQHHIVALASDDRGRTLHITRQTASVTNYKDAERHTKVPSNTLDYEWINHCQPEVTLLKIDVDGAEADLLAGAQETLRHSRCVLIESQGMTLAQIEAACPNRRWFTNNRGHDWIGIRERECPMTTLERLMGILKTISIGTGLAVAICILLLAMLTLIVIGAICSPFTKNTGIDFTPRQIE